MIALILAVLLTTTVYFLLKFNYQYWEKKGVKGPKPTLLIGNLGKTIIFKESIGQRYTDIYNDYQDEEFVGIYRGTTAALIVRGPELIKEVTVKSFRNFHDNDLYLDKNADPIFGRNPIFLKGEEWKIVRAQLTPGFTSGKMKWLYPLLEETGANLIKFIDNHPETTNGKGYDAKQLSVRFTLDNVASCAFGLQGNCLQKENSEFRDISKEIFAEDSWFSFAFLLVVIFPALTKILPIRAVSKGIEKKLVTMVSETLKYREENNVVRNDFLHIIGQLKKTCKDFEFKDIDVAAHAASFFGDGSETASMVMSFVLYELAANPDTQTKLRDELNSVLESNNQLSYENLQSVEYLDAVINEALRLHPAVFFLQRISTETFNYKGIIIDKGTPIIIPVYGLHMDPKYYDEPESYRPERFLEENKNNLTKYTFLPFGEGPRACLGRRFGILQVKVGVASIIQNFEVSVNKKTQVPIKYTVAALVTPVGGLWLDFKRINK